MYCTVCGTRLTEEEPSEIHLLPDMSKIYCTYYPKKDKVISLHKKDGKMLSKTIYEMGFGKQEKTLEAIYENEQIIRLITYKYGKIHKIEKFCDGKLHSITGPAVVRVDYNTISEIYYRYGVCHNTNGHAFKEARFRVDNTGIWTHSLNKYCGYWLNGERINKNGLKTYKALNSLPTPLMNEIASHIDLNIDDWHWPY